MAWQVRNGKRYYYRTMRVKGRYVCRYLGTGSAGDLAAAADNLGRLTRAIELRRRKEEQERFEQAQAPLQEISYMIDALTRATLLAAGFHQHDRGQWRRCRASNRAE